MSPEPIQVTHTHEESAETSVGVYDPGAGLFSDDEFQERVRIIMTALESEREELGLPPMPKQTRCLAETHTYLSLFDKSIRQMQADMVANGGPLGMLKMIGLPIPGFMRRGNNSDD